MAVHDEVELVAEPVHHLLPGGAVLVDALVSLGAVGRVGVRRLTGLPVLAACAVARERLPVESKGLAQRRQQRCGCTHERVKHRMDHRFQLGRLNWPGNLSRFLDPQVFG